MTDRESVPICPRCSGMIPSDDMPGAYPGALSRTDNKTEVCSSCGTHEAIQQMTNTLQPQTQWPISTPADTPRH